MFNPALDPFSSIDELSADIAERLDLPGTFVLEQLEQHRHEWGRYEDIDTETRDRLSDIVHDAALRNADDRDLGPE